MSLKTDSKTTTTTTDPKRVDVGDRKFTAPVADNDRDGPKFGNGALLEHLASGAMNMANRMMGIPFGMGAFGGFGGPLGFPGLSPLLQPDNPFLSADDEKWGEVEQTTVETLEQSGMVQKYGEDAVLVIANGPEDMKQLNHEQEASMIAGGQGEGQQTVVLWNPSADALTTMLKEGGFKDVVFSGHGDEGSVYMTGADGEAVAVSGDELADMFKDSDVENVFLNVCHGLGGAESVAQSLADIGVNTMGWLGSVADSEARAGAGEWAEKLADGSSYFDMWSTANAFENMQSMFGNSEARQERREQRQQWWDQREGKNDLEIPEFDFSGLDFSNFKLDLFDWDMGGNFWI